MRISDWSSDVCSSDLSTVRYCSDWNPDEGPRMSRNSMYSEGVSVSSTDHCAVSWSSTRLQRATTLPNCHTRSPRRWATAAESSWISSFSHSSEVWCWMMNRSEEHTSELQSLMRISYAVLCLKKKK